LWVKPEPYRIAGLPGKHDEKPRRTDVAASFVHWTDGSNWHLTFRPAGGARGRPLRSRMSAICSFLEA
jgi:hypothetical protein